MSQLIDSRIPFFQTILHSFDLLHIQNLGLDPIDARYLRHLVDGSLDQAQGQSLHDEMLNLVRLDFGLGGNGGKCHGTVVRGATEDGLR